MRFGFRRRTKRAGSTLINHLQNTAHPSRRQAIREHLERICFRRAEAYLLGAMRMLP